MKTMSDFISVAEGITPSAVYSESYDWAEEYADVYEEAASQHTLDIYDSSDYKFFGEACFYQEASKGLIAGGILALVSGAFFMIMKLLKGGGGGSSSKSSPKTQTSKTAKPESKFQKKEHGRKMEEPRTGKQAEEDVRKAEQEKHQPETKESTNDVNIDSVTNVDTSLNVSNNLGSGDTSVEPVTTTPSPQETKNEEKPKTEKPVEKPKYQKPAELETEENLVFNVKIIIDEIKKYKKEGYNEISLNTGYDGLHDVLRGLEAIEDITDYMVGLVREGKYDIFGSNESKDPIVKEFHEKCAELHEIVKTIQSGSAEFKKSDRLIDADIDGVILALNRMDGVTKSIESKCKEGMRRCREARTKLINNEKDVTNVDKAYKLLNGIIREVNVVCKNIQTAFKDIHKSLAGKSYPFPLNINYYVISGIGSLHDIFEEPSLDADELDSMIKRFYKRPSSMYMTFLSAMDMAGDNILHSTDNTKITDSNIKNNNSENGMKAREASQKTINRSRKNAKKIFEAFKNKDQNHSQAYDLVEDVVTKGYDVLTALLNVPIENMVGKVKSQCDVPEVKECISYFRNYIFDDGSKRNELEAQIVDIWNQPKNQGSKDSYAKSFIQEISNNIKMLEGNLDQFQIDKLKQEIDKISNDGDYDDDSVIMMHEAVKKRVYEHESEMNNEQWKRTAQFLENIGYKPLDVKAGDNVMNYKKYFDRPIPAKASDPSQNGKIKQIQRQPYELKFTDEDGKTETLILAGNCTYWKSDGPVDQIKNDKNQGSKDSDGSKQGEEKQSNVLYSPFNMQKFQHLPILGLKMFSGNDPNVYKNFSSSQRMYNTMSQIYQRLRGYLEKLKETKTYYEGMEFSNNQISIESIRIYDKYFDKNVKKAKDTKDNMHSNLRRLEKDHPELSQIISAFSTAMDNIYDAFIDMFSKNLEYYAKNDHNNTGAWNSYPELKKLDDVINNLIDDDDEDDYKVSVLYDNMFGN